MTNALLNRMGVQPSTNKSGSSAAYGAVVIAGSATAKSFTTTTTEGYKNSLIGVVVEPDGIANNATGLVAWGLWAPRINLDASAALYDFIKTDGVAGQGTPHAAPMQPGDFAIALETGTTPSALLFSFPNPGEGRTLLASATPTGTGTVSFTSISALYKKLILEYVARGTDGAASVSMDITLNNDTTDANYRRQAVTGYGGSTVAAGGGDDNVIDDAVIAGGGPSNEFSFGRFEIPFYTGTSFNKKIRGNNSKRRDTSSTQEQVNMFSIDWESTAAVNRVDLILAAGNFASGSEVRLYGEM